MKITLYEEVIVGSAITVVSHVEELDYRPHARISDTRADTRPISPAIRSPQTASRQTLSGKTLLVKSRRLIANAMGVSFSKGMYPAALNFKLHMQDRFSAYFRLI
jgi:hypothetical protein